MDKKSGPGLDDGVLSKSLEDMSVEFSELERELKDVQARQRLIEAAQSEKLQHRYYYLFSYWYISHLRKFVCTSLAADVHIYTERCELKIRFNT